MILKTSKAEQSTQASGIDGIMVMYWVSDDWHITLKLPVMQKASADLSVLDVFKSNFKHGLYFTLQWLLPK